MQKAVLAVRPEEEFWGGPAQALLSVATLRLYPRTGVREPRGSD